MEKDTVFFNGHLIPEYLSKQGYSTFGVGKTLHGYDHKKAFQFYGNKGSFGPKTERMNYFLPDSPYSGTLTPRYRKNKGLASAQFPRVRRLHIQSLCCW